MDTKNGSGNAANKSHIDIVWGLYVKVERTILYVHTDAFNELIENLKEKIQHGIRPRLIMNVQ